MFNKLTLPTLDQQPQTPTPPSAKRAKGPFLWIAILTIGLVAGLVIGYGAGRSTLKLLGKPLTQEKVKGDTGTTSSKTSADPEIPYDPATTPPPLPLPPGEEPADSEDPPIGSTDSIDTEADAEPETVSEDELVTDPTSPPPLPPAPPTPEDI